jgi:2-methylfumaryl-CoA hydratase
MFDLHTDGPYYDDYLPGGTIPALPTITVSEADNVLYRSITGDQHQLACDRAAYANASGSAGALANPALVMQYSIGQTTNATRRAIANLYYRSVRILRPVEIGETLTTTTKVLGLCDSTAKDGTHRGKVWLGISTTADNGPVARYERCALLPSRRAAGHDDVIPGPSDPTPLESLINDVPLWDLSSLVPTEWPVGTTKTDPFRDHIDMAAPLARLTFNQAAVHRDHTRTANGRRLVFGGHVQGLAQASLTRLVPSLAAVVAWDGCDHLGPAFEGDLLEFRHTLHERRPAGNGHLLRFEVIGAKVDDTGAATDILRWTPVVWAR